jgi:PilZ domain
MKRRPETARRRTLCAQTIERIMESHLSEIFGGNRRRVIRRKARLPVSVSLVEEEAPAGNAHSALSVLGYTRDISSNGLALIVPSIPLDEDELQSRGCRLRIILALPVGDVQMLVTLVRHERLDESEMEPGYLIGVSISEMSESARDLFLEYLSALGGRTGE